MSAGGASFRSGFSPSGIYVSSGALHARLARRELRRYWYARTGRLLPDCDDPAEPGTLVLASADAASPEFAAQAEDARGLGPEAAVIRTPAGDDGTARLVIMGSDPAGLLFGAYRVCEHWGVYFHVHGDSLPDRPLESCPLIHEDHKPLFTTRGLHPFHNFPEGPDSWSLEAYRLQVAQMAKMGLNFIGFHAYTDAKRPFEPQVWIGLPEDVNADGTVKEAYPAETWHPACGAWGYSPMDAGNLPLEASRLVPEGMYGDHAEDPDAARSLFNRTGERWADVFGFASLRSVRSCLGLEVPVQIPDTVRRKLAARAVDPGSAAARLEVYKGIFTRISRAHRLDMFWLYIPEHWVWAQSIPDDEVDLVVEEVGLAREALVACGAPFKLGVAGWVIGPRNDPLALERKLPEGIPLASLNPQVGHLPVSPFYCQVRRREGWAVPWMEDDPRLTVPQLWAGRTLRDAADAHAMGCRGLLGIHWRTRGLSPQLAALARGAWDQREWNPDFGRLFSAADLADEMTGEGQIGGRRTSWPASLEPLETEMPAELFQTASVGARFYRVAVPPGTYHVRCGFVETDRRIAAGGRRMSATANGRTLFDKQDIIETCGHDRLFISETGPLTVDEGGQIEIFLRQIIGDTFINAIEIAGHTSGFNQFEGVPYLRRINCGGPLVPDPSGDWEEGRQIEGSRHARPRALPCDGFYNEWALAEFGPEVGPAAGRLFARIDGRLPCITFMKAGPGNCTPDRSDWADVRRHYDFVDEFSALGTGGMGPAERDRFDYWRHHLAAFRAAARLRCAAARPDERDELSNAWRDLFTHLIEAVRSPGDLGTVFSIEQQWRMNNLKEAAVDLNEAYPGGPRIVVPVLPANLPAGADLTLRAHVIGCPPPAALTLQWRPAGESIWQSHDAPRCHDASYEWKIPHGELPALMVYRIAGSLDGEMVTFPQNGVMDGQTCIVDPVDSNQSNPNGVYTS